MSDDACVQEAIISVLTKLDTGGCGLLRRTELADVLSSVGCEEPDWLLDRWRAKAGLQYSANDCIDYHDFVHWLIRANMDNGKGTHRLPNTLNSVQSDVKVRSSLMDIANDLVSISSSVVDHDSCAAHALTKHAASLREMCGFSDTSLSTEGPPSSAHSVVSSNGSPATLASHESDWFREQASLLVTKTGLQGELVHDLQEVAVADLQYPSALACWRPCQGLRLYRSKLVTEALRLICSAPVPGLREQTSYLDVIRTVTASSNWEHHIFLFGGLVRDALRRKVGNDIDITFTAPAAELESICQKHGYECHTEGNYILIGDRKGCEYLEGMIITHNGITAPEHSDFSMNWVFYDFVNDVIIDKTGCAVPAIVANRCEIPCPRDAWNAWLEPKGAEVCFRYFKFLARGFMHNDSEMVYITTNLLNFWKRSPAGTMSVGQEVLNGTFNNQSEEVICRLRSVVLLSFDLANMSSRSLPGRTRPASAGEIGDRSTCCIQTTFVSGNDWWQRGWLKLRIV